MNLSIASLGTFSEASQHLFGFVFVVSVLTLLWVITAAVGQFFKRESSTDSDVFDDVEKRPTPRPAVEAFSKSDSDADVTDEELAALAGVVMTLMGSDSKIVSIRSSNAGWGQEGRRDHFASHRIR